MGADTSSFDILPDDALIIIFSFLTLYERLMAMRINKRCHRILSNPQAWTHLDFWQVELELNLSTAKFKSLLRKSSKAGSKDESSWVFPRDEEEILNFLKRYVSKRILAHVQQTYVNLDTLSFLSTDDPPRSAIGLDEIDSSEYYYVLPILHDHRYVHILPLGKHLRVFEVSLRALSCRRTSCGQMQNKIFLHLTKCTSLRCLKVIGMDPGLLTSDSLGELSQELVDLSFLRTEHATFDESGNVTYRGRIRLMRRIGGYPDDGSKLCTALLKLLKLTKVKTFKLSAFDLKSAYIPFNIDEFLSGIAKKWQNLRHLALVGVGPPPDEIFLSLVSALSELQEIELYGAMITDKNIARIARYLQKLTILKLLNGRYTPSGIKGLCGHPLIEHLHLLDEQRIEIFSASEWLLAVYDVILLLPKLVYVKIIGYRVIALHATGAFPTIPSNIKVDIENVREDRYPVFY